MEVESTCGGSGEDQSGRVRESLRLRREECAACGALEPEARGRLSACLGKASGKRDWRRCQANVLGEPFRVPGCPVPLPGRCREQDFRAVLQLWTQAASAGRPVRSWGVQVVLSWQPWTVTREYGLSGRRIIIYGRWSYALVWRDGHGALVHRVEQREAFENTRLQGSRGRACLAKSWVLKKTPDSEETSGVYALW